MSRYIDADKVYEMAIIHEDFKQSIADLVSLKEVLDDTPTADVVTVVRCKDCEYAKKSKSVLAIPDYWCLKMDITCLDADDFCSYGKRKSIPGAAEQSHMLNRFMRQE